MDLCRIRSRSILFYTKSGVRIFSNLDSMPILTNWTQLKQKRLYRGPAGLFRDAGFATFGDGISGNWVLELRETGLDTPTVPGMS